MQLACALFIIFFLRTAAGQRQPYSDSSLDLNIVERQTTSGGSESKCYDEKGRAQKCVPEFVNAAFLRIVEATNTCGKVHRQPYCLQTRYHKTCQFCDANVPEFAHPSSYLTDFNNNDNQTWWQSETLWNMDGHTQINLTLNLGKSFDITYIRLFFRSPRPESFAIYKRSSQQDEWIPYQFYSARCRSTYNLPDSTYVPADDQTRAMCTSEFSDISPLTGGNVAFSTLEHRPSAYDFEDSMELQEFVTATDIMIVLDKLNTFGDEVFGDEKVLRSYLYAITDLAVGGRCKCNGHGSECTESNGQNTQAFKVCVCKHNTTGDDCGECSPFYHDSPWKRANSVDANECRPCKCNGFSNRCYFDQDLYDRTSHGGHCMDCSSNRSGPNCERCRDDYYDRGNVVCEACNCNEIGSLSLQCNSDGTCRCQPGVIGENCDRCDENHFNFSPQGCSPCGCLEPGSVGNRASCDSITGVCRCKENIEGNQCDSCKPGFFDLSEDNKFGCTPCFCYRHSSICVSASGFSEADIESHFVRGSERWTAYEETGRNQTVTYNHVQQNIGISANARESVYFSAPSRFLGDQSSSYNHDLSFSLHVGELAPQSSSMDVILEGAGITVSATIFAQGNSLPSTQMEVYTFRLHESGEYGWSPHLQSIDFMALLGNLTAIKIRGTYAYDGRGFLDGVKLETARFVQFGEPATWVEICTCPEGYVGQFCESCAPGFRHDPPNGGPFAECRPCDCNKHADICDSESGKCICEHNTAGNQCGRCAKGYYGNALVGTPDDCDKCPCPENGACTTLLDESVVCLECPKGYIGPRCQLCTDGFFGDARGRYGAPRPCEKCDCNGNIDSNAVANCNRTTGECLKCIYNTGGFYCDQCLPGFFGDALAIPKGDCRPCRCNIYGTLQEKYGPPVCDQISGQCDCKPHISGRTCDTCDPGYWNITSEMGCESCGCDPVGSESHECDVETGHCTCRQGVVGRKCDICQDYHYGFSTEGCKPCECDETGSISLQCDANGQCHCRDNVEGRICDRCRENKQDKKAGCKDCPPCYTLVFDAISIHRERLAELERLLSDIMSNPTVLNDVAFEEALDKVMKEVDELWQSASLAASSGGESTVEQHLQELTFRIEKVRGLLQEIMLLWTKGRTLSAEGEASVGITEQLIQQARDALRKARVFLEVEGARALDKATDTSNQFGQQSARMSEIAREARRLADKQEDDEKSITGVAYDAHNISSDAYILARKANDDQNNITQVIKGLQGQLQGLLTRHKSTIESASTALSEAKVIYKQALNINTEASSIGIPPFNASQLRNKALAIDNEAQRLKYEIDDLMSSRSDLLLNIEEQLRKTEELKNKGLVQQQETAELLARVYVAKKEAELAVQKADHTLEEAQETFKTLEGFGEIVRSSRQQAELALDRAHQIEEMIEDAQLQTTQAENALRGAESDAKDARSIALSAQNTAAIASREAGEVRVNADMTQSEASGLKDEADRVAGRVMKTSTDIEQLEQQAYSDKQNVDEAQAKANTAKDRAETASMRVQEAYELVREILQYLDSAEQLDTRELDELEKRLEEAYRMYTASDIEKSVTELSSAHTWQQRQLSLYDDELVMLRIEVDNIQEIKESLPDGCFKQSRIET